MKKNLSRLISIVCLLGLMVTAGFAQVAPTATSTSIVFDGTVITSNVPNVLKSSYLDQEAIRNASVEGTANYSAAENRIMLITAILQAYNYSPELERASAAAYTRQAEILGKDVSSYKTDADFLFLEALITQ